ncbi:CU044_5270 family protein [Streptomyces albicerus]|uniref:CU044_5270 family protein n=1 Tax=Streptomyces albicerus TaxID=2569859 RepID=UPI00124B6661|nr:CU044_5270 family protein [Streptomyces albicerus]
MKNDVLQRLAAARPAHLDPGLPTPSQVRQEELATLMSLPRASRRARAATRSARVRRPLLSGLALATASVVAAVVMTDTAPERPGPAPSATLGSGSQVLLAAASHVERQPAASGKYWYVVETLADRQKVPGKNYSIDIRQEVRWWTAAAKNRYWSQSLDVGARPATEADEAAWKADGSPMSWDMRDVTGEIVTYAGKGEIAHDAPGGIADSVPMGEVPLRLLPTLPTDAKALRKRLFELVDKHYNGPEWTLDRIVVEDAVQLATTLPSTPALRAAAYRLLAAEPGVRSLGDVKDHAGRTGYAVALTAEYAPGTERRLIFDKSTGMPLGQEMVSTRSGDGRKKGDLLSYTTFTMKWTNQAPPFNTDYSDPPADLRSVPVDELDVEAAR